MVKFLILARWRSGNAGVCKTSTARVRFPPEPQKGNSSHLQHKRYCLSLVVVLTLRKLFDSPPDGGSLRE